MDYSLKGSGWGELRIECHYLRQEHLQPGDSGWYQRLYPVLIWTRQGEISTWVKGAPRPLRRCPGSVVLLPAGRPRRSVIQPGGCRYLAGAFSFCLASGADLLAECDSPLSFTPEIASRLGECLARLAELASLPGESGGLAAEVEWREIQHRLLRLILAEAPGGKGRAPRGDSRLQPVMDHLRRHFSQAVDLAECLRLACLSKAQFYRRFRALTGLSPQEFVNRLRLGEAERLLMGTDLNLAEISARVGWEDQFYFSRCFQKTFGLPPGRYRRAKLEA